jgi:hypothetical protein
MPAQTISRMWLLETPAVKRHFHALADADNYRFRQYRPNYQYIPRVQGEEEIAVLDDSNLELAAQDLHMFPPINTDDDMDTDDDSSSDGDDEDESIDSNSDEDEDEDDEMAEADAAATTDIAIGKLGLVNDHADFEEAMEQAHARLEAAADPFIDFSYVEL